MQQNFPDDLQQAINEVYLWVKAGCTQHEYLHAGARICANISWISGYEQEQEEVCGLLFGENKYPFNNGVHDYINETNKFANLKRLAWLNSHQTAE